MAISQQLKNSTYAPCKGKIISPERLRTLYPLGREAIETIARSRNAVSRIVHRRDHRLLVIAGPCSIHDLPSAQEYACRLKELHEEYKDNLFILMRTYFEKPRTTVGWKGFINDPELDNSFEIEKGLCRARELLLFMADLELPCATEALDPVTPLYLGDLISWVAVGARTTESQVHREMASDLPMPVGFKNGTDGNVQIGANAMKSAASSHRFLRTGDDGHISVVSSRGNPDAHLILRGGQRPNYTRNHVLEADRVLAGSGVNRSIIVDCSHGNAKGGYRDQLQVAENIGLQIRTGTDSLAGIMLESHLHEGRQKLVPEERKNLLYGVSITDACIGWDETRNAIHKLNLDVSISRESTYEDEGLAEVV